MKNPLPSDRNDLQKIILGCRQIVFQCKQSYWQIIWQFINSDTEFGKDLIQHISYYRTEGRSFLGKFNESEIAKLFVWIVKQFPYTDDKIEKGAHFVGQREEVGYFRDHLISVLKLRGSNEAKSAIEYIKNELPELEWLNRVLYETKIISRIKTWVPPSPYDILILARDRNKRYIKNEDELLQIVIESLKRLEEEMHGETPTVLNIWNSAPAKITPKDENSLSDFVKVHLKRYLENVIVNREVEIRGRRGIVPGEEPDILVQTFKGVPQNSPIEKLSLIIEIKCCWHKEFTSAMQTQLLERYLKNNQCKYGLYLAGWYLCDSWDKSDYRFKDTKKLKMEKEEINAILDKQAIELSQGGILIKSFVLDCRMV